MKKRRSFLRSFGLLGVAVAGASAAMANNDPIIIPAPTPEEPKTDFALKPEGTGLLHLQADNRTEEEILAERKKFDATNNYMFYGLDNKITNELQMSVGKDNRLWIKVNDEWRRVSLDA
jgi:hypothetical protein